MNKLAATLHGIRLAGIPNVTAKINNIARTITDEKEFSVYSGPLCKFYDIFYR